MPAVADKVPKIRPESAWVQYAQGNSIRWEGLTSTFNITTPISLDQSREFKEVISSFAHLEEDWDGYGASVPRTQTIRQAQKLIDLLPKKVFTLLHVDDIWITPYGTIEMDFKKRGNLVSVEIGATKVGFFTKFVSGINLKSEGEKFLNSEIPNNLSEAITQLINS
jgi:hypothetical protein